MRYKDTTKPLPVIAGELGVVNILEGSVRRAGNEIRIVAQLINARTDDHIWADTYDSKYADIFSIQSDVALKITTALQSKLSPAEKENINTAPTNNTEAYDYYLKGNHFWYTETTMAGNLKAVEMYQKAIELDPNFGQAYARISVVH